MNSFVKGILLGVGIGLLTAPMTGEEMRNLLNERLRRLQGYLPESDQWNTYTRQVSERVSQTASNLKDYAQQAASTVKSATSNVSDLTQKSASEIKQTGQDVSQTTKQNVKSTLAK